jgi:glycosyltransferase involved in cell wall biosynthesis
MSIRSSHILAITRKMERESMPQPRISLIVPVLNEAENLPHVLPMLPSFANEIILIDGRSTDETVAVARRLLPKIIVIEQTGQGKGDALRCGFARATGDILVMFDADGSADPAEIPRFVAALQGGADFAKGSRFMPGGGSDDITRMRKNGNMALTRLVNALFGAHFTDLCYGYNAFWRDRLESLQNDCDGFEIETILILRALKARLRMAEVPSHEHPRLNGESKLNAFRDGWRIAKIILHERRTWNIRGPAPLDETVKRQSVARPAPVKALPE